MSLLLQTDMQLQLLAAGKIILQKNKEQCLNRNSGGRYSPIGNTIYTNNHTKWNLHKLCISINHCTLVHVQISKFQTSRNALKCKFLKTVLQFEALKTECAHQK